MKYTKEGKIKIAYRINKDYLKFSIADSGIGMNEEACKKVFNRFHKIEDSGSNVYRGGGLGLAIYKNLTEALGGKIWVKSEISVGSVFYFTVKVK